MQSAARSVRTDSDFPRQVRAQSSLGLIRRRSETYEILTASDPIRNRMLMPVGAKDRPAKESIMLDIAFVALGCAVLALMGVYAHALRQL
jgi:hypothetical protein